MATITVTVPELGENVDAVDVVQVLVEVGDEVAEDQGLVEVETDKAAVEIPSTAAGTVTEIHVEAGASLHQGDRIVTLEAAEKAADEQQDAEADEPDEPAADEAAAPSEESDVETSPAEAPDAATAEQEQQESGTPPAERSRRATTADDRRLELDRDVPPPGSAPPASPAAAPPDGDRRLVPAAPTVRRFARQVGVDIARVEGSGPRGRISIDDVKGYAKRLLSQPAASGGPTATLELPDLAAFGPVRREPMSKVRQLTADAMARAAATIPQVTNHELADITGLEELRQRFKPRVEAAGGSLTLTAILVKVVAAALKSFPTLNAAVDMARHEIVYRESIHVGVAVDTERGLLVPVVRDADRRNIREIAVALGDLAGRARDRKLKPEEMQGATFTISNLGGIGGTAFTPIVNWPQVAILGVSRGRTQPEWVDGAWQPRLMLPLSLSYDHRLVDGADAARFLAWLAEALASPLLLALEG